MGKLQGLSGLRQGILVLLLLLFSTTVVNAALINYSISSASGDSWTGTFDVNNTTDPIFTASDFKGYVDTITANGGASNAANYFGSNSSGWLTWNLIDYSFSYQMSFTSEALYTDIRTNNFSWGDIVNNSGGYSLSGASSYTDLSLNLSGSDGTITFSADNPSSVPEPSTFILLSIGAGGVLILRKRMKKQI